MQGGINTNVVQRWRQLTREGQVSTPLKTDEFVQLPMAASASEAFVADIRIEFPCGPVTMPASHPIWLDRDLYPAASAPAADRQMLRGSSGC